MDNSLQIVNTNREMQEWADKIRACRRGAQGSAIIYSLVETAKENRFDPFKYLVHVLSTAKKIDLSQKDSVDLLLPENAPAECRVNFKK